MPTQIYPNAFPNSVSSIEVNGALVPGIPNFNSLLPVPPAGQTAVAFQFDGAGNIIGSALILDNASITIDGLPVSDDFDFFVNSVDQDILIDSVVPQNASPIYVDGAPAS